MGRITEKLSGYWHEVAFGWRATRTWADQYALLLKTIQFHTRNGFGCACDIRSTVTTHRPPLIDYRAEKMKIARFFSRRLAIVVLVAVAGLVGWRGRESLLQEAADLWVVSDPLTHADAIVVLGGNSQTRPPAAAELYRRGLANKVLVSHWSDSQRNRAALLKLGVPASAIEAFGKANTNTREEAVALRQWTERN